jgi:molybdopterin adenylyltransferase
MISAVITISDTRTSETDTSGNFIKNFLMKNNFKVSGYELVTDDKENIEKEIKKYIEMQVDLIITTGGTGLSKRDNTPEVTKKLIEKEIPGISEAIRNFSLTKTKNAMLSRGISGINKNSLIINLPGSEKAVKEILPYIIEPVIHGIEILKGNFKQH